MMVAQRFVRIGKDNLYAYRLRQPVRTGGDSSKAVIADMMGERYVYPRHFATKTKGAQRLTKPFAPRIWKMPK